MKTLNRIVETAEERREDRQAEKQVKFGVVAAVCGALLLTYVLSCCTGCNSSDIPDSPRAMAVEQPPAEPTVDDMVDELTAQVNQMTDDQKKLEAEMRTYGKYYVYKLELDHDARSTESFEQTMHRGNAYFLLVGKITKEVPNLYHHWWDDRRDSEIVVLPNNWRAWDDAERALPDAEAEIQLMQATAVGGFGTRRIGNPYSSTSQLKGWWYMDKIVSDSTNGNPTTATLAWKHKQDAIEALSVQDAVPPEPAAGPNGRPLE